METCHILGTDKKLQIEPNEIITKSEHILRQMDTIVFITLKIFFEIHTVLKTGKDLSDISQL